MPNLARNEMIVYGKVPDLQAFMSELKQNDNGQYQIINSLFPCPQELYKVPLRLPVSDELQATYDTMMHKYGVANWYEWQHKHWGIKWGDYETELVRQHYMLKYPDDYTDKDKQDDVYVRFHFQTAWSHPYKAFDRISKMFPTLHFEIITTESGMEWKRKATFHNGLVEEVELEYHPFWDDGIS